MQARAKEFWVVVAESGVIVSVSGAPTSTSPKIDEAGNEHVADTSSLDEGIRLMLGRDPTTIIGTSLIDDLVVEDARPAMRAAIADVLNSPYVTGPVDDFRTVHCEMIHEPSRQRVRVEVVLYTDSSQSPIMFPPPIQTSEAETQDTLLNDGPKMILCQVKACAMIIPPPQMYHPFAAPYPTTSASASYSTIATASSDSSHAGHGSFSSVTSLSSHSHSTSPPQTGASASSSKSMSLDPEADSLFAELSLNALPPSPTINLQHSVALDASNVGLSESMMMIPPSTWPSWQYELTKLRYANAALREELGVGPAGDAASGSRATERKGKGRKRSRVDNDADC